MNKIFLALLAALTIAQGAYAQQSGYADQFYPVGPKYGTGWDLTNDAVSNSLTAASIANGTITHTQISGSAGILGSQLSGSAGITGAQLATNTVESSQLGLDTLQHVTVPLTSAQILGMYATPVQLVAAPSGATQNIVVEKVLFTMTATSTAYTGGTNVVFQIGNTAEGGGTATTTTISHTVVDAGSAGTTYTVVPMVGYTGTPQTGLYISVTGSTFATGTGTAVVDVWYSIQ